MYRPNPARRLTANSIGDVLTQCHKGVDSGVQPNPHNTIDSFYAMWELLTGGKALKFSNIPTLQPNWTAPMRRVVMPRSFTAAMACGEMMSHTELQAAHDKVHPTLQKWVGVIEACHQWIDGNEIRIVLPSES